MESIPSASFWTTLAMALERQCKDAAKCTPPSPGIFKCLLEAQRRPSFNRRLQLDTLDSSVSSTSSSPKSRCIPTLCSLKLNKGSSIITAVCVSDLTVPLQPRNSACVAGSVQLRSSLPLAIYKSYE